MSKQELQASLQQTRMTMESVEKGLQRSPKGTVSHDYLNRMRDLLREELQIKEHSLIQASVQG